MRQDTIAAIATAPGMGGIGIIRLSGPEAERILYDLFVPAKGKKPLENRKLTYGRIMDGEETADECMAVVMKAPGSYTREDVAEIQSHGGTRVLNRVLDLCIARGARLAESGEFTRRAFVNGRIDLSRAEAVMSLISARGEQEYRSAVRQMEGGTADFIRKASDDLYELQAGLAACIDYPEEISDEEGTGMLRPGLEKLIATLSGAMDERSSRLIHDGLKVTLYGTPNAGKSSLLNALLGQERAIVTSIPGTTRDTVEGEITLDGIRILLTDTAGLRETEDPIERIGVERSEKARRDADVAILVLDGSRELTEDETDRILNLTDREIVVINKNDLAEKTTAETVKALKPDAKCVSLSALDEESLKPLKDMLRERTAVTDNLALTQPRHLDAARRALKALKDALMTLDQMTPDMAATDLQAAQAALGEITGDRADEKLLDSVFSRFCVGK
ncbi:MAG: tRNA uridine-5-carboxymethylaminomethyl(34) synthesis GTPase MnmE [Clostridiales bacterium]|nr:tRNA uridine-5-carboxymethylaminomethyl(34) synthesis GTPase MnmE [Clostridiales bacterium]